MWSIIEILAVIHSSSTAVAIDCCHCLLSSSAADQSFYKSSQLYFNTLLHYIVINMSSKMPDSFWGEVMKIYKKKSINLNYKVKEILIMKWKMRIAKWMQRVQLISISALGSVNGKKEGRKRTFTSAPYISFTKK